MLAASASEIGNWLVGSSGDESFEAFANHRVADFFNNDFDGKHVRARLDAYNKQVEKDKDRVRLHGQYYNNIYLGKRIYGPSRKQVFNYTIVGGMERRFEIIENQVNHIPFTHEMSDRYPGKVRNPRIKCRDDTRVVLQYPEACADDFIHANRVHSPILFNDFIITQSPMETTVSDFWRMIWQEQPRYIFMLISRRERERGVQYWPSRVSSQPMEFHGLTVTNRGLDTGRDPFFQVTRLLVQGPDGRELRLEHWQGDLNDSDEFAAPLRLLRLARCCTQPTVVHDHLGVSRAACLVAVELTIAQLVRGPIYKRPVQQAVHYLRSFRPFSVETPMQYIYIHRVVQHFIEPMAGLPHGFRQDYHRWLDERSQRLFVDDLHGEVPAFRLISPKVDPDLLPLVRHRERPEYRREMHAHVGELPLPAEHYEVEGGNAVDSSTLLADIQLPKRYPRGPRYDD